MSKPGSGTGGGTGSGNSLPGRPAAPGTARPRGWSVLQGNAWGSIRRRGQHPALRGLWEARRGGIFRAGIAVLLVWGLYNMIAGSHGVLELRRLQHREADLLRRSQDLTAELREVNRELQADPSLAAERGIREKFLRSRPNEIVYHFRTYSGSDSATGSAGGDEAAGRDSAMEDIPVVDKERALD